MSVEYNKTRKEAIHKYVELKILETLYKKLSDDEKLVIFTFREVNGRLIYTYCDGELLGRLGFKKEQVIGKDIFKVNLLKNQKFFNYYVKAWKGKEVFVEDKKFQGNMAILFWLCPIKDKNRVHEVVGICFDISEMNRMQEWMLKKEKKEIVKHLAAGVAHEIRNPLTSIKGFLQLIELSAVNGDNQEYFTIIKEEIKQIENVINGLLLLGQTEISPFQKQDLYKLVDDVICMVTPQAMINNVEIKTKIDGHLPPIICDGNKLKKVFVNIINNAIEATPFGGQVMINIDQISEESILIQCVDHGCGIEEERILKLSEPFYSTKEKGIGLGLMASFKIIEDHGGQIKINSKVNLGTTIEIILPINPFTSPLAFSG